MHHQHHGGSGFEHDRGGSDRDAGHREHDTHDSKVANREPSCLLISVCTLTYNTTQATYWYGRFLIGAAAVVVASGGVRAGRPENTAAIIISRLLAEQRPLSGVAPPLECRQRSSRANAVSG